MTLYEQLDQYQKDAVEFALKGVTVGYFGEQGVGKTWIAAGVIEKLWPMDVLLVVPLTNLVTTWAELLSQQWPCCIDFDDYDGGILLLHYEALPVIIKRLRKRTFDLIVYDECHKLKNRQSKQSKFAARISSLATYRLGLSGTPIETRPQDLWAQMRFIAPHVLGTWTEFEERWLEPVTFDPGRYAPESAQYQRALMAFYIQKRKQKFRFELLPAFLELLRPYCLRVASADVLALPAMHTHNVPVVLLGLQKALYEALERDFVSELTGNRITAGMKAIRIGKLQQVCGGWVKDDNGTAGLVGHAKQRACRRLVVGLELPVVIACRYVAEVTGLATMFGQHRVAVIYGKIKPVERQRIQTEFQAGLIDVLIVQQRTGGVGIDLFRSHNLILYSTTFSSIDYEQMKKRVHRRGQTKPVNVFSIFAQNTVDEDVAMSLAYKHKVIDQVLSGLQRRR